MRHFEIPKNLLPILLVPVISGTSPTPSGRQLMKTAITAIGNKGRFRIKHMTTPLDTTDFR